MPRRSTSGAFAPTADQLPGPDRQALSLDDVNRLYPSEWVLLEVRRLDERQRITHGVVLKHSKSRAEITKAVQRARRRRAQQLLCVYLGGMRTPTAEAWRESLARAAALGPLRAGW